MTLIKMRRGTTEEWATENPILSPGEPGVDLETGEYRIGNGLVPWADLPSASGAAVAAEASAAAAADSAADAVGAVGNKIDKQGGVVFSSLVASGIGGADQAAAINAELRVGSSKRRSR